MNVFGLQSTNYPSRGFRRDSFHQPFKSNLFQGSPMPASSGGTGAENRHITLKTGYLYSAGSPASGQELHMKYDESSTKDDPVMLVTGKNMLGDEFTEKIHINEINPEIATPAEMTALSVHLRECGDKNIQRSSSMPLMVTGSQYDVNTKMDFKQYYNDWISGLEKAGMQHKVDIYESELERYLFYFTQNKTAI